MSRRFRVLGGKPIISGHSQIWQRISAASPTFWFPLWDAAGASTAEEATGAAGDSGELVLNPGFETAGGGGADVFGSWSELAQGSSTIEQTATAGEYRSGSAACKLTTDAGSAAAMVYQAITTIPGYAYTYTFYTRGDGTNSGQYRIRDLTNSVDIQAVTSTGVTGASFTQVIAGFTAPAGCVSVRIYFVSPGTANGWACFDDVTMSCASYPLTATPSNVTFGQTGIGDGKTSALFNGSTSYINILSNQLNSLFNGSDGTLGIFVKPSSASVWSDAANRRAIILYSDDSNHAYISNRCDLATGQFRCGYAAGGTHKSSNVILSYATFFSAFMTYSASADELKFYINGIIQTDTGTGLSTQTGLGTWAGNLTLAMIGAAGDSVYVYDGWEAHAVYWDSALSAATIHSIVTL